MTDGIHAPVETVKPPLIQPETDSVLVEAER
jgi:hypothetical protein